MKTLKALIKYSKHKSLEYLQGYLCGISCLPHVYDFDDLIRIHFNELTTEQLSNAQRLIDHAVIKLDADFEFGLFSLPKKCVLTKKNYEAGLQENAPLVQWSKGILLGLKQTNKNKLKQGQKQALNDLQTELTLFTSLENAKQQMPIMGDMFESMLIQRKKYLSTLIHNFRFELHEMDYIAQNDFYDSEEVFNEFMDETDEEQDELNELLHEILQDSSLTVLPILNDMIAEIEKVHITTEFITQNSGVFWLMEETQTYMMLCAHRAYVYAEHKQYDKSLEQMHILLKLNPNDNQGVRYTLANVLCITKQWADLKKLETEFPDEFITFTAAKALRLYAEQGDSKQAQTAKKQLKRENKHFMKILTGQEKSTYAEDYFKPGDKSEVGMYLNCFGKQAWLANEGSLFWLRKK